MHGLHAYAERGADVASGRKTLAPSLLILARQLKSAAHGPAMLVHSADYYNMSAGAASTLPRYATTFPTK